MKVEEFNEGAVEIQIMAAMIVHDVVCGRVAAKWGKGLFSSEVANRFGSIFVHHYRKHGKAPGISTARSLFISWCEERRDEESIRQGERYWAFLQEEAQKAEGHVNPEFVIDLAYKQFRINRLQQLADKIKAELEVGHPERAEDMVLGHVKVELGADSGLDVMGDEEEIKAAFVDDPDVSLIKYNGALGHFFRGVLDRECLVAFCGPEKSGKSWMLMDLAWRAATQGLRVAFFELGDQTKKQVLRRFGVRAARWPRRSSNWDGTWPCKVAWPKMLEPPEKKEDWEGVVTHEYHDFDHRLSGEEAWEAMCRTVSRKGKLDRNLVLSTHAAGTLDVPSAKSILDGWALDGWAPDVIVFDYADLLADPPGRVTMDFREATGRNWEMLRAMSAERHALVVTATQTTRDAYNSRLIGRKHISEDKRKLAHVSALAGINVCPEEKETGQFRLNWPAAREKEYSMRQVVHVAGCLALANPCVLSIFP